MSESQDTPKQNAQEQPTPTPAEVSNMLNARMVGNALTTRSELARFLGGEQQRNISIACGYPDSISTDEFKQMWKREGLGKRVVTILPDECWAMSPVVSENEEVDPTPFEDAWLSLEGQNNIWYYLHKLDRLCGIGRFGVMLLGIDDGKELNEPVDKVIAQTTPKKRVVDRKLLYVRVFDETHVVVKHTETDTKSSRFGKPAMYSITFVDPSTSSTSSITRDVHWSRLIHVADNCTDSEVYGDPRQEVVWNRLLDMRKELGSSAEMFWLGAFPGYALEADPALASSGVYDSDSIKEGVENYTNGLSRYIAMQGITVKSLSPQAISPKMHIDVQLQNIALTLGIPLRVFLGTESGQLASGQDAKAHRDRIDMRRKMFVTPKIILPTIQRLIAMGVLEFVELPIVAWPDMSAPSDEDKAKVAKTLTEAMALYTSKGIDSLMPPKTYLMEVLGYDEATADAIEKAMIGMEEDDRVDEDEIEEEAGNNDMEGPDSA